MIKRTLFPRSFVSRIRSFARDDRAGVAVLLALAIVPLIAILGLATDAARGYMVKARLSQAVDAAALAGGRSILQEYRNADIDKYFESNFRVGFMGIQESDLQMDISVDEQDGFVTVDASARVPTTFLSVLNIDHMNVSAHAVVARAVRGMELVLAMDNTGSMRGGNKIGTMKDAAEELIEILYGDEEEIEDFYVGLVPYAATVNIGNENTQWLAGGTPIGKSENLRLEGTVIGNMDHWNGGGSENAFDGWAIQDGDSGSDDDRAARGFDDDTGWVGKDWGPGSNIVIAEARVFPSDDRGFVSGGGGDVELKLEGSHDASSWTEIGEETFSDTTNPVYLPVTSNIAYRYHRVTVRRESNTDRTYIGEVVFRKWVPFIGTDWKGCVEARPSPYDETDDTADVMPWMAQHWPSTIREFKRERDTQGRKGDNDWPPIREANNWENNGTGPNLGCPPAITSLRQSKSQVVTAIQEMEPWHRGGTMSNLGLAWAWRALSPNWQGLWPESPVDLPLPYDEPLMDKVVILLTDGVNQWYDWPDGLPGSPENGDYSDADYTTYGRLSEARLGTTNNGSVDGVIDDRMSRMCANMKAEGIIIYTITFQLSHSGTQQLFRNCATDDEHYFNSPSNDELSNVFRQIGQELSNLRLAE